MYLATVWAIFSQTHPVTLFAIPMFKNRPQSRRSRVRTPPGCKVFRNLYIALLLSKRTMHCHCVNLRKKMLKIFFKKTSSILDFFLLFSIEMIAAARAHLAWFHGEKQSMGECTFRWKWMTFRWKRRKQNGIVYFLSRSADGLNIVHKCTQTEVSITSAHRM
jgi:hypothetical protein